MLKAVVLVLSGMLGVRLVNLAFELLTTNDDASFVAGAAILAAMLGGLAYFVRRVICEVMNE